MIKNQLWMTKNQVRDDKTPLNIQVHMGKLIRDEDLTSKLEEAKEKYERNDKKSKGMA